MTKTTAYRKISDAAAIPSGRTAGILKPFAAKFCAALKKILI